MHYRKPVQLLQKAVAKTQAVTSPVEPYLDKAMGGIASLGCTIKTKVCWFLYTYTHLHMPIISITLV